MKRRRSFKTVNKQHTQLIYDKKRGLKPSSCYGLEPGNDLEHNFQVNDGAECVTDILKKIH